MNKRGRMSNSERQEYIFQLIQEYLDDKKEFKKKLIKKYSNKLFVNIPKVIESSIDNYYEYETDYKRKYSLYNSYKFNMNKNTGEISIHFYESGIESEHPGKGKYIYEWMFGGDIDDESDIRGGWHGGDIKGKYHPNPGTPWLRSGVGSPPRFVKGNHWLRQASRTESPYQMIIKNVQDEINLQGELMQEEFNSFRKPYKDKIKRQIRILIGE